MRENIIKISSVELAADSSLTHVPGIILDPVPNPNAAQDLTADGIYGSLLYKSTNYSSNNLIPLVWKIISPVGNTRKQETK